MVLAIKLFTYNLVMVCEYNNNIAKNICDLFLMCKNVKLIIFDKNNQL